MLEFAAAPAALPPGQRVYAIGDVHGCNRELAILHELVAEDLARRPVADPLLIHIGDYVDRGPDSAGVIARLLNGPRMDGMRVVNLMGNHEHTMLAAVLGERAAGTDWLYQGGRPALESYGIDPDAAREHWRERIPQSHIAFMRGLTMQHREGGYLFVHAGIRPGIPLDQQAPEDLLRIRQPFLYTERSFGVVVVHGHTPVKAPVVRANRIAIDTGAVFGGSLTCAVLEGRTIGFLHA